MESILRFRTAPRGNREDLAKNRIDGLQPTLWSTEPIRECRALGPFLGNFPKPLRYLGLGGGPKGIRTFDMESIFSETVPRQVPAEKIRQKTLLMFPSQLSALPKRSRMPQFRGHFARKSILLNSLGLGGGAGGI
jgi:hypothetical protein